MMHATAIAAQSLQGLGSVDLSSTRGAVLRVVHDPTSNITLSILLLAGATLVVLLVVTLLLSLAMPSRKKVIKRRRYVGTPEEIAAIKARAVEQPVGTAPQPSRPTGGARRSPLLNVPVLLGLGVLLLVAGYVATSTDAYCARTCHSSSNSIVAATKIDHASCASCHEGNIVTGAVGNAVSRLRMVASQGASESATAVGTPVESGACMHCHRSIRRGVVVSASGVKMSHAEVIAAGRPCTSCHADIGHRPQSYTLGMSGCVTCHDSRTASAECTTCHSADPLVASVSSESTQTVGSGKIAYPAVHAANRNCSGCHDQAKECDTCHGIRMPHSATFIQGGHAIYAAFESKLLCWRCHDPAVCAAGCHSSFEADSSSAHGKAATWRVEHQAAAWNAGCACHFGRSDRKYPICYRCHDPKTKAVLPKTP